MKRLFFFLSFCAMLSFSLETMAQQNSFTVGKNTFLLNGKPFVVKAAEVHYPRIPRPYWEHRIKMCKALGMNTLCLYVFWNIHEQKEGVYDFTGNNDIAAFCRLAQKHGMYVIVRPGPYVCAEWEMGGLPWWLLKKKDIKLRTQDPYFMECVERFEKKVGEQLAPLTIDNGGPIIMVQVENEYGSYGEDKPYVSAIRDIIRRSGFDKVQLFQCDWSSNFELNGLDDLLWTMNFGTGADILKEFKRVGELRPDAPKMCSEYWSGWFDGWGRKHETRPADKMVEGIATMLDNGISFSLYMTHGGTSFGWWAGSNNTKFSPDCTSYDYDAPINEQGAATEKYHLLRAVLQKHSDHKLPAIPKPIPVISFPEVTFNEVVPLLNKQNMPDPKYSFDIQPMEQFDMGYGCMVYSACMPETKAGALLRINEMNDYGIVYIGGKKIGELYRGSDFENTLRLPFDVEEGTELTIFIEAVGRVNYSKMIHDPKGITKSVEIYTTNGHHEAVYSLKDWDVYLYPAESMGENMKATTTSIVENEPAYYRASFNLKNVGDTYLDMHTWGRGMVWVNGHCLGRFWNVGPQQTLYLPGCWLKKGKNDIVVLDILGPSKAVTCGQRTHVVDELHSERIPKDAVKVHFPSSVAMPIVGPGNDAAPGAK